MKKIAVFFLSVFACLGGILFSACGEKVNLTVSDNFVTIFKNDENQTDYLQKEIFVSVNAWVDVREGDCVRVTQPEKNRNGKYSFKIYTFDGETASDEAELCVTSIDDPSQSEQIYVSVKTVAEAVSTNASKSQNLFIVKGDENGALLSDTYFDFSPKTANVKDLDWTFENGQKTISNDADLTVAEIVDNRLKVYDGYTLSQVKIKATLVRDPSIPPAYLTYEILNGAVIESLSLSGNVLKDETKGNAVANLQQEEKSLILGGSVQTEEFSFQLKRNESDNGLSQLRGSLVVNVQDGQDKTGDLKLTPVFFKKDSRGNKVFLQKEEYENFVRFKQDGAQSNGRRMTYSFSVEARTDGTTPLDVDGGEATLYFYLDVSYEKFDYSVSTDNVPAEIVTSYKVIDVDLSNENGDAIGESSIDVYSSYAAGDGYKILTLLKASLNPNLSGLRLDDNRFYLSLDASKQNDAFRALSNQPDFDLKDVFVVTVRGVELEFVRSGNTFIAEYSSLTSGTEVFVRASDKLSGLLTNVKLDFISQSDINISSSVYMNLYKISGEEEFGMRALTPEGITQELDEKYFMSTIPNSQTNTIVFSLRIYGLNTIFSATSRAKRLTLEHTADSRFVFSDLAETGRSSDRETEQYVDVSFTVSLATYNFESKIFFWFVHTTGKKTAEVEIDAFVPLDEASVDTTNSSSASIYMEEKGIQSYYQQSGGGTVDQSGNGDETIQKLVVEAGSLILLRTQYEHTTGVEFRAISLEDLRPFVGAEEDIERLFQSKEDNFGLDVAVRNFAQFRDVVASYPSYFSIQTERLTLTNVPFKGYVCAIFSGYNAEHQPLKLLRFFALESIFAVNYLVPEVASKTLYTTETLSETDIDLATMDVAISARADGNAPSYFKLENFKILSSTLLQDETNNTNLVLFSCDEEGNPVYGTNDYYTISGVSVSGGRVLRFVITANSTKLLKSFSDTIVVQYTSNFNSSYSRTAAITIKIENVKRVEEVVWTNKVLSEVGEEPEIYLNLTSKNKSERTATISTSIGPSDAYILTNSLNTTSVLELVRDFDNSGAITITQNKTGNVLNLEINPTNSGTSGYIYLLPKDMIKRYAGTPHILAYKPDGNGGEVATYIPREDLAKVYDDLVGVGEENETDGEYVNYFYSGDKKVQNSAVILKIRITVADGSPNHDTEEEGERLAIRIYSANELRDIDTAKWYRVMNNIQLSNWKSFENFSGRLFGNTENITLNFVGDGNQVFVKNNEGTLKNLIFAGNVVSSGATLQSEIYSGFVADVNRGTFQNVSVDVLGAKPSNLRTQVEKGGRFAYVGGLVGLNMNTVSGSKTYGLSISTSEGDYVGGLVGKNSGKILGCGVEFYDFADNEFNKISASSGQIGGFVGVADQNSTISNTYLYAYSLDDRPSSKSVFEGAGSKSLFVASVAGESVKISESFAFAGTLNTTHFTNPGSSLTMENCYFTYYNSSNITTYIYKNYNQINPTASYILTSSDIPSGSGAGSASFQAAVRDLGTIDAWEVNNIEKSVNFGFMHLKNTKQTIAVSVDSLKIKTTSAEPYKSLFVSDNEGILFFYDPVLEVDDTAEQSQLLRLNTLNFTELFDDITQQQERSLILTSTSEDVLINATSVQVLSTNTSISLVVHSKMDYSVTKTFTIAIINNLPQTTVKVGENPLVEDQIIMLQKGNSQQKVVYSLKNFIYLNGREYETKGGFYQVDFCFGATCENESNKTNPYVSIGASNNSLTLTGLEKTEDLVDVTSFVRLQENSGVAEEFASAVRFLKSNHFRVSVFEGATFFEVEDEGVDLSGRLIDHMVAHLVTDNADDLLAFAVSYGELSTDMKVPTDTTFTIDIDANLSLVFQWSKQERGEKEFVFTISVKIAEEKLHLVKQNYEGIQILLCPSSQIGRQQFVKSVSLDVLPKNVDDIFMSAYQIEDRTIRNSRTFYLLSDKKVSTLTPGSDAILAVQVDPAFALMDKLQIVVENAQSLSSSVSISRLSMGDYGYFVSNRNSKNLPTEMGIEVDLDEKDLTSDGYYYFRIYLMSSFSTSDILKLTAKYFYKGELQRQESTPLKVDYVPSASVRVNGQSTYLMSKGSSATVTVTINLEEKLGDFTPELDDLYLQGHGSGISLTDWSRDVTENSIVYTATLICYVNATLQNGSERGEFYVAASVESMVDGKVVTRVARATICLVDFTLDAENIRLSQTGVQTDGYDVFHAYYNMPTDLTFNYPVLPEEYEYYDPFNAAEAEAVKKMTENREKFFKDGYYSDPENQYYINYSYDAFTGNRYPLTLKEQLWIVRDDGVEYRIHNGDYWLEQPSFFNIDAFEAGGREILRITGTSERGQQLMKLQTVVSYEGKEFVYDYYFMVVVSKWSDEELPTQITTGEEFVDYLTNSLEPDDYILMNDIVLDDYTPLDTDLVKSLDGNGYTIHINSWAAQEGTELKYALFDTVFEDSVLKNVRVNLYDGGQISVDVSSVENSLTERISLQVAGFAIRNNGIIYNSEVVSYKSAYQKANRTTTGIVVKYTKGVGTDPIYLTDNWRVDSTVVGFVINNSKSIVNCRVGGESFRYVENILGTTFISTHDLGVFTIEGQKNVSGFVGNNSANGYVSASFVDNVQINNPMQSSVSVTAGFAIKNENSIMGSYVEGKGRMAGEELAEIKDLTNISSTGIVAGFVYDNASLIKNCYSNIGIENEKLVPAFASGFVYINEATGFVNLCYSASPVNNNDINQLPFSGVSGGSAGTHSLNEGRIERSYFHNSTGLDTTDEGKFSTGATPVADIIGVQESIFYGFSFASDENSYDGIWQATETGISLVSANKIAFSNRIAVGDEIFYNKTLYDSDTLLPIDISYGSENNPIIIRNAYDFAMATGEATPKVISAYREYYTNTEVFGTYRLVNNIDMSEINQNVDDDVQESVKLTTTTKTFSGILDGNGFVVSNITLRKENDDTARQDENFGLFAKLQGGVVMNIDLTVSSIYNLQANMVGTLAGTSIDSRILSISLSPMANSTTTGISVQGKNIVGGVVGLVLGESNMFDITVTNIEIFSRYRDENKQIPLGETDFRELALEGYSLLEESDDVSYAGAVAGYVDVFSNFLDSYVQYAPVFDVSTFNIVNVHANTSVDIYGEIVGGLFGYVGKSTCVYDATLTLDAASDLTTPSYITSKDMFAGGLVGENYGGLFAVSASYSDELQDSIESDEHAYYTSSGATEFGQQSIFSRTERDESFLLYHNDVKYIGGLVGYMGGGYIHIGYSKLNTISYNPNTIAVGGIIGLLGHDETTEYQLTSVEGSPYVNVFLKDVYSSGDIYIDAQNEDGTQTDGFVAGIVGALLIDSNLRGNPSIAMQNVLAENFISTTTQDGVVSLAGDKTKDVEGKLYATKHFMLAGKAVGIDGVAIDNTIGYSSEVEDFVGSFLIVNSINSTYNVFDNTYSSRTDSGADTVGGYRDIMIGSGSQQIIQLRPFGFKSNWMPDIPQRTQGMDDDQFKKAYDNYISVLYDSILCTAHIGDNSKDSHMRTPAGVYVQNNKYFLENGWEARYWVHTQDKPFPHIQLVPVTDIYFWDDYNTFKIMQVMQEENGTSATIVLRGKVDEDDEHSTVCKDIDLRTPKGSTGEVNSVRGEDIDGDGTFYDKSGDIFETIKNFRGRLISYSAYTHDESMGTVTSGHQIYFSGYEYDVPDMNKKNFSREKLLGGNVGDDVGIILDKPMFGEFGMGGNAQIEGITFYLCAAEGSNFVDYSLVQNPDLEGVSSQPATSVTNALFRNVGITLNDNVKLTAKEFSPRADDDKSVSYATGLIAPVAYATTFNNIKITSRQATFDFTSGAATKSNIYLGALVGYLRQNTSYINISLQGISFETQNSNGTTPSVQSPLNVNYNVADFTNVFAGLYAGKIARGNVEGNAQLARVNIGLTTMKNVNIVVNGQNPIEGQALEGAVYVGGFAGEVVGVDNISFIGTSDAEASNDMTIRQNIAAKNLYAGLGFGRASSSTFSLDASAGSSISLSGGIYQVGKMICDSVSIGGLVGHISNNSTLSGVAINNFVVAHVDSVESSVPTYVDEDGNSVFEDNNGKYDSSLSPYVVKGQNKNAIGGIFGFVNGANVRLLGKFRDVSGVIDVAVKVKDETAQIEQANPVALGGLIGRTTGSLETDMSADINLNISVSQIEEADESLPTATAYVGGIVGLLERPDSGDDLDQPDLSVKINSEQSMTQYIENNQTVVSNINAIFYGGAIGYVEGQKFENDESEELNNTPITINNVVFGGALKVYGNHIDDGQVSVGGVVGGFGLEISADDGSAEDKYNKENVVIRNSLSYGDVFVIYDDDSDAALSAYNFGGIVGKGAPITVRDCKSIMTNFNSRLTKKDLKNSYNVGAIAGNPNGIKFENNFYSSVVCLTYQVDDGNKDASYGDKSDYIGYSQNGDFDSNSSENILSYFTNFINTSSGSGEYGLKLRPATLTDENKIPTVASGQNISTFHNIKWVALTKDVVLSGQLSDEDEIIGTALIGNGVRITRGVENHDNDDSDEESDTNPDDQPVLDGGVGKPGLVNSLSEFGIISGFVIDYDNYVYDLSEVLTAGGVAQTVSKNSIVYAVGVEGEMSIGVTSEGKSVSVSGIVGELENGMINECYTNLDLQIRAKGTVSGIASTKNENGLDVIKSSYSAGEIELLLSAINTHLIVSGTTADVVDCYSITQVKKNYTDSAESEGELGLYNQDFVNHHGAEQVLIINASYSLSEKTDFAKADTMSMPYNYNNDNGELPSAYGNLLKFGEVKKTQDGDDFTPTSRTLTPWFFTPFTNNGYAVHGFGFLKNVSVYTRTMTNSTVVSPRLGGTFAVTSGGANSDASKVAVDAGSSVVPVYEYEKVDYLTLCAQWSADEMQTMPKTSAEETPPTEEGEESTTEATNINENKWFLGIANLGKFEQMLSAVEGGEGKISGGYSKHYRFRIENDILYKKDLLYDEDKDISGQDLGQSKNDFILDGDNHTISFSEKLKNSLFGVVVGRIENLRLSNISVSVQVGTASTSGQTGTEESTSNPPKRVGTLAQSIKPSENVGEKNPDGGIVLLNITVEGEIANSTEIANTTANKAIGGVVGEISSGYAIAVDSLVTISVNQLCAVGGVVGALGSADSASAGVFYSSNAGQIVVENNVEKSTEDEDKIEETFRPIAPNGKPSEQNYYFQAIAGGIVGVADAGSIIDHCYNDNGVLSGFTKNYIGNYSAGGIVGYVAEGSVQLKNNVNTALVGAGNYTSDGYAYAGGIVGYSQSESETFTIEDNTNNGPVQAIGKMNGTLKGQSVFRVEKGTFKVDKDSGLSDAEALYFTCNGNMFTLAYIEEVDGTLKSAVDGQKIEEDYLVWSELKSAAENPFTTAAPTNKPNKLKLEIGMIYNPTANRKVYAFGIGYTSGSVSSSGNSTTSDNIKNDGNIGQHKAEQNENEEEGIVFDRAKILSNPASNPNFWGYFEMPSIKEANLSYQKDGKNFDIDTKSNSEKWFSLTEDSLKKSGYDSYGFPVRWYVVDEITRLYKFNDKLFDFSNESGIEIVLSNEAKDYLSNNGRTMRGYNGDYTWNNEIYDAYSQTVERGFGKFPDIDWRGNYEEWHLQTQLDAKQGFAAAPGQSSLTKQGNEAMISTAGTGNNWNLGFWNDQASGEPYYNFADFMMPQTTQYAESANFKTYDKLLKENVAGLSGSGNLDGISVVDIKQQAENVHTKIEEIDNKTGEDDFEQRTIDGKMTAFVRSGMDLLMVTDPYSYNAEVSLEKLNEMFYNADFTKPWSTDTSGFILSAGGKQVEAKFEWVGSGNSKKLKISANLPKEYDSLTLLYSSSKTEVVKLGKNNVIYENGNLKFDLRGLLESEMLGALRSTKSVAIFQDRKGKKDDIKMLYSIEATNGIITAAALDSATDPFRIGLFFEDGDDSRNLSIKSAEIKNGSLILTPETTSVTEDEGKITATFKIDSETWRKVFNKNVDTNGYFGIRIEQWMLVEGQGLLLELNTTTNSAGNEEFTIKGQERDATISDFRVQSLGNLVSIDNDDARTLSVSLSQLLSALSSRYNKPTEGKVAFGSDDLFSVNFDGLSWKNNSSESFVYGDTELSLSIEDTTLKISASTDYDFAALIDEIKLMSVYYNISQTHYKDNTVVADFTNYTDIYSSGRSSIRLATNFQWVTKDGEYVNPSVEDGTVVEHFGISFRSKEFTFMSRPKENYGQIVVQNCNFGYEAETWNSQSGRYDLIIGDNLGSDGIRIAWENWDQANGVTFKFVYHITAYTSSGEESFDFNSETSLQINGEYDANNLKTVTLSAENIAVTVDKLDASSNEDVYNSYEELYKLTTSETGGAIECIETRFDSVYSVSDDKAYEYSYIYRIFNNNGIVLDYVVLDSSVQEKDDNNTIKKETMTYKITRYVKKTDGQIDKYLLTKEVIVDYSSTDGDIQSTINEKVISNSKNISDGFKYFKQYSVTGDWTFSDVAGDWAINVDYVVTHMDSRQILFSRYNNDKPLTVGVKGNIRKWQETDTKKRTAIYADESCSVGKSNYGNLNAGIVIVDSYQYKEGGYESGGEYKNASGNTFRLPSDAEEGRIYTYSLKYTEIYQPKEALEAVEKPQDEGDNSSEFGQNMFYRTQSAGALLNQVLFVGDINSKKALNERSLTIFGAGYFWRYHSMADDAVINSENMTISNLKVIVSTSGEVLGKQIKGNDVSLYGNISNFESDLTISESEIKGSFSSKMTISSLDVARDKEQTIKETEKAGTAFRNIIIAGNGKNGQSILSDDGYSIDGGSGGSGERGGKICLDANSDPLFVRVGVAGQGGYGADGQNGYFDTDRKLIILGTNGGKAGDTPVDKSSGAIAKGKLTKAQSNGEPKEYDGGGETRNVFVAQSAGCGGIKGFAVIDCAYAVTEDKDNWFDEAVNKLQSDVHETGKGKNLLYYYPEDELVQVGRDTMLWMQSDTGYGDMTRCFGAKREWYEDIMPDVLWKLSWVDTYRVEKYWRFGNASFETTPSVYLANGVINRENLTGDWWAERVASGLSSASSTSTRKEKISNLNVSIRAQQVQQNDGLQAALDYFFGLENNTEVRFGDVKVVEWTDGRDINFGGDVIFPDGSGSYVNDEDAKIFGDGKVRRSTVEDGPKWEANAFFGVENGKPTTTMTVYNDSEDRSGEWYGVFDDSSDSTYFNAWDPNNKFVWDRTQKAWKVNGTRFYYNDEVYRSLKQNTILISAKDGYKTPNWIQFSFLNSDNINYLSGKDWDVKLTNAASNLTLRGILGSRAEDGTYDFVLGFDLTYQKKFSLDWKEHVDPFENFTLKLQVSNQSLTSGFSIPQISVKSYWKDGAQAGSEWTVFGFNMDNRSDAERPYLWWFACNKQSEPATPPYYKSFADYKVVY